MNKIEGARKLGPRRGKRIRRMNSELAKIDETIKESEKVLETVISKLKPAPPSTKRIERKITELNKKIRRAKRNKVKEALIAKREA